MEIVASGKENAQLIASIISDSNKDIAALFHLTIENTPKHPSFYSEEWVLSDFTRGEQYFLCREEGFVKGCVAFEQPDAKTAYLNRLSVLPLYRHKGIGERLVRFILDYAKVRNIEFVSIGIIAEHRVLKNWYLKLGFVEAGMKKFEHLPFDVLFMHYKL